MFSPLLPGEYQKNQTASPLLCGNCDRNNKEALKDFKSHLVVSEPFCDHVRCIACFAEEVFTQLRIAGTPDKQNFARVFLINKYKDVREYLLKTIGHKIEHVKNELLTIQRASPEVRIPLKELNAIHHEKTLQCLAIRQKWSNTVFQTDPEEPIYTTTLLPFLLRALRIESAALTLIREHQRSFLPSINLEAVNFCRLMSQRQQEEMSQASLSRKNSMNLKPCLDKS